MMQSCLMRPFVRLSAAGALLGAMCLSVVAQTSIYPTPPPFTQYSKPIISASNTAPAETGAFGTNEAAGAQPAYSGNIEIMPFGSKGEKPGILFLSGEFVPPKGEKIQPSLARLAQIRNRASVNKGAANEPSVYAMIVLHGRLDDELNSAFLLAGVELTGYYPNTAYQARIPVRALNEIAALPQVMWIGQPSLEQKVDPQINAFVKGDSDQKGEFFVRLFGADLDGSQRALIAAAGAKIGMYDPSLAILYIEADSFMLRRLVDMDSVLFIEPVRASQGFHTESMASVNADMLWGVYDGNLVGGSIKVGVMDSGLNAFHQDFGSIVNGALGYNRTTEAQWYNDLNGHGSHVTGTFLGEGISQWRYRGVAAGIRNTGVSGGDLLISKIFRANNSGEGNSLYEGLLDMQGRSAEYKRQIFNLSGGGWDNTAMKGTDAWSIKVDEMFQQNIIAVIAAGNDGASGASSVGAPGVSKGAITVGNLYDDDLATVDTLAPSSSRGPTGDARIKPDVCAPGRWIDSVGIASNSAYNFGFSGTSMATPHVAGLLTGFIQQYNFPAWAVKAVTLATAIDLGLGSNNQGRGKVDAMLLHYDVDGGWAVNWDSNGGTGSLKYIDFTLSQPAAQVKLVLVWPDAPAASGAAKAMKNDLDLGLQTTGALDANWNSRNYTSQSSSDTVEMITINNLPAGTYRIKVYTYSQVEGGSQAWAVARKVINSSTSPNLSVNLSTPYAVKPNVNFDVTGTVTNSAYVATAVYGDINLLSGGIALNGMTYFRRAPNGGEESLYFNGDDGINQGNLASGRTRKLSWSLRGTTEGVKQVRYDADPSNDSAVSVTKSIIVDGTVPASWTNFSPSGNVSSQTPTCTVQVSDILSGLDVSTAEYQYSTNGGSSWSSWNSASCSGADGTTALQTITASNVPFNQSSTTQNKIRFRISDMAGNQATSGIYNVSITKVASTIVAADMTGRRGQTVTLSATLTRTSDGALLGSRAVQFKVDGVNIGSPVNTNASGVATTNYTIPLTASIGGHTITAEFAGDTTFNASSDTAVLTVNRVRVQGTITPLDYIPNPNGLPAQIIVKQGASTELFNVTLNSSGSYGVETNLTGSGTVSAIILNRQWLRKRSNVTLSSTVTADFSLFNGDTDRNGVVNDFDLAAVVFDFGGPPNGLNGLTDLDGNGIVNDFDLAKLIFSFGKVADPQ